jgi:hypothetical protein
MQKPSIKQDLQFQLFGWILFIFCAVLFLASSIRNRDAIAITASLVFLIACFVFMIPLIKALYGKRNGS